MVVTLIGYRGTGKTSVAMPLAWRLGWTFQDADDAIETFARRSIREIFEEQGESGFRQLERRLMTMLLKRDRLVIAAGGGAVLDPDTRREMKAAGPVVWLTAPAETIMARISEDPTTSMRRPNLTDSGGLAEIESLLRQREPIYRGCADIMVSTNDRDVNDIIDEIVTAIEPRLTEGEAG